MTLTLRRAWLILVLSLGLLAGLLGLTMRAAAPMPVHAASNSATHQVAFVPHPYCPPPPYSCW